MQQIEGSQSNQPYETPIKEQTSLDELPSSHEKNPNFENFGGCVPNQNSISSSSEVATSSIHQQPETLNLPAVLWDKPAGSKIRVPPPVPPRSPRKPMDPVGSGAFEEAMKVSFCADPSQENVAPQRGLQLYLLWCTSLNLSYLIEFYLS